MPATTVEMLVELLGLAPHPEGGYFKEIFRSTERVQRRVDRMPAAEGRSAGTAIYFLLPADTFSAWHSVRSDEAWHHYDGTTVELHTIDPDGNHCITRLGRDLARGERPQHVVPAGWLQAARPIAPEGNHEPRYALCGCTVCPGFEFADFEMPSRTELRLRVPALRAIIDALTRE
jgi:hypothetical protein